jgi:signal transduction histidine kinase
MAPSSQPGDLSDWFGRLQRAYMASGDETVLEEAADLGRLMAVTDVAAESVIEVYGEVLTDALAAAPHAESGRLVAAAGTVLSELMLACRLASQRVALDDDPMQPAGPMQPDDSQSEFARFRHDGTLDGDRPGDVYRWLDVRVGHELCLAAQAAVAQRRIAMFETTASAGTDPMRLIVCPFHDGGGIIAIRDVKHLVDARERAFQRRKLESVGQVTSGLAHELNNLLQPILSMAQMAQEDYPADTELAGSIAVILDSTRRAAAIVHGMLLYVRRAPKELRRMCLAAAVTQGVDILRRTVPAGVRLDLQTGGAEGWVAVQPDELNQIIKNLVDNAVHAMSGHGEVKIRVDEVRIADALAVRMQVQGGRYARLSIADNGHGISPTLLEQIFEPFLTTKGIGEGTGLGLSIVQGIVRSWGGCIIARNVPEGGASFDVMLPLGDLPTAPNNDKCIYDAQTSRPALDDPAENRAHARWDGVPPFPWRGTGEDDRPPHAQDQVARATTTGDRDVTEPNRYFNTVPSAGSFEAFPRFGRVRDTYGVAAVRMRLQHATADLHLSVRRHPDLFG